MDEATFQRNDVLVLISHLDHGGVVALVGEDLAAGHVPGQREPIGVTIQSSGFGENTEEVLL